MSQRIISQNVAMLSASAAIQTLVTLAVVTGGAQLAGAQDEPYSPEFTSDQRLKIPEGKIWRESPFIGTPLTPNALNSGSAPFPEFHIV